MTYQQLSLSPTQPPLPTPLPSSFTLKAPPGTDIWRKPPSTSTFNAPFLYRSLPFFTFRRACVTVSADWRTLYDQGGLCLALPVPKGQNSESSKSESESERRWIKSGIEFYNGAPMVSTVACDRWADWSLLPLPKATSGGTSGGTSVTVEMEREVLEGVGGSTLCVYVMEGVEKRVVREVTWVFEEVDGEGELDGECWVGVYAAKPTKDEGDEGDGGRELSVEFEGLVVETF